MRQIIDPRTIDFSAWHGGISTTEEERGEWNNMYSAERTRSLNGYLDKPCDGEIKYLLPFMRQMQGPSLELASGAMRIMMQLALHGYEEHGNKKKKQKKKNKNKKKKKQNNKNKKKKQKKTKTIIKKKQKKKKIKKKKK